MATADDHNNRRSQESQDSQLAPLISGDLLSDRTDSPDQDGSATESQLTLRDAFRLYPGSVLWSLFFSLGIIMLAYDPQLLGNLYATPAFQRDFGYVFNGKPIISAAWQTGLSMGSPLGQIFGALAAGYPMDWYGPKRTFSACVCLTTAFVFTQVFAPNLTVLLVGELLGGLVLGTYAVIAPAYASEVCPLALRGILTSYVSLSFVIGQLLANCVTAWTSRFSSHWAYTLPFTLQWVWPVIILAGIPFAPESPWWLVRHGRHKDAQRSLQRLASPQVDVVPALALIIETDKLEQAAEAGSTYADCFMGTNRRRTTIAVGVYCLQVLSGIYLVNYATEFFELAGLPTEHAFSMGIAFLGVGVIGTCLSWFLMQNFARRSIYNYGLAVLAVLQFGIAALDFIPSNTSNAPRFIAWTQSVLLVVWNFAYDLTIGPLCFVLICEVSSTRLRAKTIALATAMQAIVGIGMTGFIPFVMNTDAGDNRGMLALVFGTLAALGFVWAIRSVPETKDRTFEELDILFEERVPTKLFAQMDVGSALSRRRHTADL